MTADADAFAVREGNLLSEISSKTGPIEAFIPVFVFAILFGLSTDYQVFLVGRCARR